MSIGLIIYSIISGLVCMMILPLVYIDEFDGDILQLFFVGVFSFVFGWLIFPIILLIGCIGVIRRMFKKGIGK